MSTRNGTHNVSSKLEEEPAASEGPASVPAPLPAPSNIADAQPDPEPATPFLSVPDAGIFQKHVTPLVHASTNMVRRPNYERLNLFILRHASAGTRRTNPKLDVKRPLDKEGKRHCFHLAHILNALRLNFDLIVSSSLKRCLQTAQLIGTETGYESKILHADALMPNAEYAQFARLVHECRSYENVLLVGHNPTLTFFLGQLIDRGAAEAGGHGLARVRLRKGSLARVTIDHDPATLQWLLHPRIVRSLYETSTKSSRRKTSRK